MNIDKAINIIKNLPAVIPPAEQTPLKPEEAMCYLLGVQDTLARVCVILQAAEEEEKKRQEEKREKQKQEEEDAKSETES